MNHLTVSNMLAVDVPIMRLLVKVGPLPFFSKTFPLNKLMWDKLKTCAHNGIWTGLLQPPLSIIQPVSVSWNSKDRKMYFQREKKNGREEGRQGGSRGKERLWWKWKLLLISMIRSPLVTWCQRHCFDVAAVVRELTLALQAGGSWPAYPFVWQEWSEFIFPLSRSATRTRHSMWEMLTLISLLWDLDLECFQP